MDLLPYKLIKASAMLYQRCRALLLLLWVSFVSAFISFAHAQAPPNPEPFLFDCGKYPSGLGAFIQDLFNDITCPIDNSYYFLFILAVICAFFIITSSLIRILRGEEIRFLTKWNIISIIFIFVAVAIFIVQYDPPYFFDGFSRERKEVPEGESLFDCTKDRRKFIHFIVNFFVGLRCPNEASPQQAAGYHKEGHCL